jgi:hypothetical protein
MCEPCVAAPSHITQSYCCRRAPIAQYSLLQTVRARSCIYFLALITAHEDGRFLIGYTLVCEELHFPFLTSDLKSLLRILFGCEIPPAPNAADLLWLIDSTIPCRELWQLEVIETLAAMLINFSKPLASEEFILPAREGELESRST